MSLLIYYILKIIFLFTEPAGVPRQALLGCLSRLELPRVPRPCMRGSLLIPDHKQILKCQKAFIQWAEKWILLSDLMLLVCLASFVVMGSVVELLPLRVCGLFCLDCLIFNWWLYACSLLVGAFYKIFKIFLKARCEISLWRRGWACNRGTMDQRSPLIPPPPRAGPLWAAAWPPTAGHGPSAEWLCVDGCLLHSCQGVLWAQQGSVPPWETEQPGSTPRLSLKGHRDQPVLWKSLNPKVIYSHSTEFFV